jgi:uncharacterized membrane protein
VSNLIAVAYPDKNTAVTVRERLMQLTAEHVIELEDAVVIDRDESGKVKLHQPHRPAVRGAAGGALCAEARLREVLEDRESVGAAAS